MSNTRVAGEAAGSGRHSTHGEENPTLEGAMSKDVVNIGLNQFQSGINAYSESQKDLLTWLWGYVHDDLHDSKSALVKAIGYDYQIIHSVFTGRYEGDIDTFCAAVVKLKRKESDSIKLVETPVTRRVIEALDYCRDTGAMVTIKGPTGRSKTSTAIWWAKQNNHGRTRYIRIPSGCTRRVIVQCLCRSCGIGVNGKKTADLEWRLFRAFNSRNVIIVDEAGHLMPRCGTGTSAIEFLRDLNDICGTGIAMIFTDVYLDEMKNGRLRDYFEQFIGRIKFEITIPTEVLKTEVAAVVRNFRADAPDKLIQFAYQLASGRDGKLRTLFEDLQRATGWARRSGQELDVKALKTAADWRKSGGVWDEE